jgi:hypothetical protein
MIGEMKNMNKILTSKPQGEETTLKTYGGYFQNESWITRM